MPEQKTKPTTKPKEPSGGSIQDKIKAIEDEMSKMQYNKATQHHYGLLKAKIAILKERLEKRAAGGKKGEGFTVKKSGDATVILIGFPSVGKSTLLNTLTSAQSKIAAYAFTTLTVIPGVLEYNKAKIQILDVPGILAGAAAGTGRGKEVIAVVRNADLVLFIVDVFEPHQLEVLKNELYQAGLRLNERKPEVVIKTKPKGGLSIATTVRLTKTNKDTIASVLREFRIPNADVVIRDDITIEQFIDAIEGNKHYVPAVVTINKIDLANEDVIKSAISTVTDKNPHGEGSLRNVLYVDKPLLISAEQNLGTEDLKKLIFNKLKFIRIYLKEIGKKPDYEEPLIMRSGSMVQDVCSKLHRDFVNKFKFAKIWGPSAKFPGQSFMLDHKLADEDVLEIHLR